MGIFEEAEKISQDAQEKQKLREIVDVQRRIIALHEQIFNAMAEHEKILMETLLGNKILTPEQEETLRPLHFAPMQLDGLGDQLNAAREELRALDA